MDATYYKLDSQVQVSPDVYRKAVLLTILIKVYIALLLVLAYICMAAF
jgi:hypothetical protein